MNTALSWIKAYVPDLDVDYQAFRDAMTLSGTKVEGFTVFDKDLENIVIGQILKIEQHPDADKLVVCQVNVGDETIQIVTGASNVFDGSIVSYSDRVKINVLGVPSGVIEEKTAVSYECAAAMAQGAYRLTGADIAVSVTGYAGPGDGEDGTPCGTVYIGWCDKNGNDAVKCHFDGDRNSVRLQTRDKAYEIIVERANL